MAGEQQRERNLHTARVLLDAMGRTAVEEMLEHYAPDVVVELPFAPEGLERRHEGREAAAEFMRFARDAFSSYTTTVDAIYAVEVVDAVDAVDAVDGDADTIVAEVRGHGVAAATGRPYEQTYVLVLRFGPDGRLRLWREYYDPGVVIRAFGPGRAGRLPTD